MCFDWNRVARNGPQVFIRAILLYLIDSLIKLLFATRLGFDHEHSRSDRDQNVKVFFNNTNEKPQFQLVNAVNEANLEAPYDFHSIIHYTTYQGSNNIFKINPVLLSRLPVLISTANEIEFERELLTPIDVYKIQRFYNCSTIKATDIQYEPSEGLDKDRFENILRRFTLETHFKGVSEDVVTKYDYILDTF